MTPFEFWRERLAQNPCPPPGGGVNRWVFARLRSAARLGVEAADAVAELPRWMTRPPRRGELERAAPRAYGEAGAGGAGAVRVGVGEGFVRCPRLEPTARGLDVFYRYAQIGERIGFDEDSLREASPAMMPGQCGTCLDWEPGVEDAVRFLERLFVPGDLVLLTDKKKLPRIAWPLCVFERDAWIERLRWMDARGLPLPKYVQVNPVRREPGLTKDGEPSYRAKASVAAFRHTILERDAKTGGRDAAIETQVAFWGGWGWENGWRDVVALVHSGNKSIHTVFRVYGCATADDWEARVAHGLFAPFATMGFDASFAAENQLARLPGAWRRLDDDELESGDRAPDGTVPECNRWKQQRLLFLSGEDVA